MKIHDQLSLALRMFKTRPMRTALTVLGVGVGIGTVLFLVSLGYGLQQTILNRIASADTLLTLDVSAGSEKYALTANAVAAIGKLPHVTELSRLSNLPAQATEGALTSDSHVMLIDPSFFRLSGLKTEQGKAFEDGEKPTAVISSAGVLLFGDGSAMDRDFDVPVRRDDRAEEIFCPTAGAALYRRAMLDEMLGLAGAAGIGLPLASR